MEAESMVHALEQVHDLLIPGGYLIDIHPNGELVEFNYHLNGSEQFLGYMQESDNYIEYRQADEAIQNVLNRDVFQFIAAREFEFRTYADSFDELKAFLEANWSDAVIPKDVSARAGKLESEYGKYQTILREQVKVGLLKRI